MIGYPHNTTFLFLQEGLRKHYGTSGSFGGPVKLVIMRPNQARLLIPIDIGRFERRIHVATCNGQAPRRTGGAFLDKAPFRLKS
jgi:hypothetical protein